MFYVILHEVHKRNTLKSITAVSLLILFFATVVCKDFYHLLGHKQESVCHEKESSAPHFHSLDKCVVCSFSFTSDNDAVQTFLPENHFTFIAFILDLQSPFVFDIYKTNQDTRGSPLSA